MMRRFILLLALYLSAVSATESTAATPNMRKLDYGRPDRLLSSATQQHRDLGVSAWWISLLNHLGVSCPHNVEDQCPHVGLHHKHCCESSHHSSGGSSGGGGGGGGGDDDDDDSSSASDDGCDDDGCWDDDGWEADGHDDGDDGKDDGWNDDGYWEDDAWGSDGYINSAKNGATTSSESGRFKRQGLWAMGIMAALFAGLIALVVVRRKRRNAARDEVPENVYVEGGAVGTHDDVNHGDGNYNGGGRSKQGMSRVGSMKSSLSRGMGSIKSKFSRNKEADDDDYEAHFDNDEYGNQGAYM